MRLPIVLAAGIAVLAAAALPARAGETPRGLTAIQSHPAEAISAAKRKKRTAATRLMAAANRRSPAPSSAASRSRRAAGSAPALIPSPGIPRASTRWSAHTAEAPTGSSGAGFGAARVLPSYRDEGLIHARRSFAFGRVFLSGTTPYDGASPTSRNAKAKRQCPQPTPSACAPIPAGCRIETGFYAGWNAVRVRRGDLPGALGIQQSSMTQSELRLRVVPAIGQVPAEAWDGCANPAMAARGNRPAKRREAPRPMPNQNLKNRPIIHSYRTHFCMRWKPPARRRRAPAGSRSTCLRSAPTARSSALRPAI